MRLVMCSVFDTAAQVYGRPVFVNHRSMAVRSFTDEVNRKSADNTMAMHPSDFELYYLGVFEDSTGEFVELPKFPELIVRGVDVAKGE